MPWDNLKQDATTTFTYLYCGMPALVVYTVHLSILL